MLETLADATLTISGAWLPGDSNDPIFPIGDGYRDTHQREVFDAVREGAEAVLNTNPTGGGKTLSWVAPVIRSAETDDPMVAMATYPTRALLRDQERAIKQYLEMYCDAESSPFSIESGRNGRVIRRGRKTVPFEERVQTVTGRDATSATGTKADLRSVESTAADAAAAGFPTIVLTTPDTLTLMASNRYREQEIGAIPDLMDLIVVDEFHLANPRGKRLLPFHLDVYQTLGRGSLDTLVFLSATPAPDYVQRVERAFDTVPASREVYARPPDDGRKILPEVELGVTSHRMFRAGEWLSDHIEEVKNFATPPGQLLVVVDSVREVEAVSERLETESSLQVGRIYGWQDTDRQRVVTESDIVVGNTAVEVGIDFDRVNRMVFTAHDPNSALQRFGRMRANDRFDDHRALMITKPGMHDALATTTSPLSRPEFETLIDEELGDPADRTYYELLCGAYAWYLWEAAEDPLCEAYLPDAITNYQEVVDQHFGSTVRSVSAVPADASPATVWNKLNEIAGKYQDSRKREIFKEMHTFRGSSLSCAVIDVTDDAVKEYSLRHVLRTRRGEVIPAESVVDRAPQALGRDLDQAEKRYLQSACRRATCGVVVTGRREEPRKVGLHDNKLLYPTEGIPQPLPDPLPKVDPPISGLKNIELGDSGVLGTYINQSPHDARENLSLGPYAAVLPFQKGSMFLWQDAILAHSEIVDRRLRKDSESAGGTRDTL